MTFRYLHEGKLFVVPTKPKRSLVDIPDSSEGSSRLHCYWLCHSCTNRMEVCFQDGGILLVPVNQVHDEWSMT